MSDETSNAKGTVKKKKELTQEAFGNQGKELFDSANLSQHDIERIIGIEEQKHIHGQKLLINRKEMSTKDKEVQGGPNNKEDPLSKSDNENNYPETIFKPKKSISRTPTKDNIEMSESKSEGPNKRPRSETSPELISTKRQCEGFNNEIIENEAIHKFPSVELETQSMTSELDILKIISALEKIEKITGQEESEGRIGLTKNNQTEVRDATSFLHRNLTLLVYKLGSLEKENLILKHNLENVVSEEQKQKIPDTQLNLNEGKIMPQLKKTYANVLTATSDRQEAKDEERIEWRTPKTRRKHETIIRVDQITDSKKVIQELRKEINTKNTEGGFKKDHLKMEQFWLKVTTKASRKN